MPMCAHTPNLLCTMGSVCCCFCRCRREREAEVAPHTDSRWVVHPLVSGPRPARCQNYYLNWHVYFNPPVSFWIPSTHSIKSHLLKLTFGSTFKLFLCHFTWLSILPAEYRSSSSNVSCSSNCVHMSPTLFTADISVETLASIWACLQDQLVWFHWQDHWIC